MKIVADPTHALARGLDAIRREFAVPASFPPPVLAAAERAAARTPDHHVDRTDWPFVTLDPASSTDLDQAFTIERSGTDLLLHYAIADVAWFVDDDDPVDVEAWVRGTTLYLPDGKAGLYPPVLGEGAASLLPDVPRPAVIFTVRINPEGGVLLDGAERAIVRSRAKLAYDGVAETGLPPGFAELAARIQAAEDRRGAARIDPPEQEVARSADEGFELVFRRRLKSEDQNAALSLATNLAVASRLLEASTGLFRIMPAPDERAVERLRQTARAFDLRWPAMAPLAQFERTLDPSHPRQAAFMMAVRRAGGGAAYAPFQPGVIPWHAPMAATYAHATAPLRRLADRYVVRAALAVANGQPVSLAVSEAFARLPAAMARANAVEGKIERATIDLAEAVMLRGRQGSVFAAIVTEIDSHGARVQLRDWPVVARIRAEGVAPGDQLRLRLNAVDVERRTISFEPVD